MIKSKRWRQWMLWYATVLHWTWGCVLLSSPAPLGVTAIATIIRTGMVSATVIGLFYLLIALLGVLGIFAPPPAGVLFLLPQALALWLSALGAIEAMITGTFADGVVRTSAFLITDQAPAVIAAVGYTVALFDNFIMAWKSEEGC